MDYFEITPKGMDWLHTEIAALKARRPTIVQRLAAAAALGDRSENAEYTESKRELRQLDSRVNFLDKESRYGEVITVVDDGVAALGKTVTIQFDADEEPEIYTLVGPAEADMADGNLTKVSPLGAAVLDHRAGDEVVVQAPAGAYSVTILGISVS